MAQNDDEERVMLIQRVEDKAEPKSETPEKAEASAETGRTMLIQRVPEDPVNKRKFLILYVYECDNEGGDIYDWNVCIGRQACYDDIVSKMESEEMYLDLIESKIIAETATINQAKSLYEYLDHIIENELIPLKDGEFYPDIDEYLTGDIDDYDLKEGIDV